MYIFRDYPNDKNAPGPPERISGKDVERIRLYARGAFEYSLDELITRWLKELAEQGLSSGAQKQAKGLGRP
jgi:hypothetical protein